ncbi:Mannan endo-1,6-alpha-mannosidase, partial [Lachnellula willkommii]
MMVSSIKSQLLSLVLCFISILDIASGITLDVKNQSSIISATHTIAHDLMSYYTGNTDSASLGVLPKPYYWWEAGALWGTMISYWHYTNDSTYVSEVGLAILSQAGPNNDFIMANQVYDTGNDDQAFWALTAMSAVEFAFPVPTNTSTSLAPSSSSSSSNAYLTLAINTFNAFVSRWNTTQCNGGLKWQFTPSNAGFDYKSTISNGGFFQLAARLARHTGNATYREWAEKEWDWMTGVGFINETTWSVIDGAGDDNGENCSVLSTQQWTYNNAIFLYGAAVMSSISIDNNPSNSSANVTANSTSASTESVWLARTKGLLAHATSQFFTPYANATDVMYEWQCEESNSCDLDQYSFKAYLSRWMTETAVLVPSLKPDILALLTPSAQAAALACSGGVGGAQCGTKWYVGGYDGVTG